MTLTPRNLFIIVAAITAYAWGLIAWWYFTSGVPVHHVLQRADMPGISNWWGALILPLLAVLAVYRVKRRVSKVSQEAEPELPESVLRAFAGALLTGILLATFFVLGATDALNYLVYAILIMAIAFPLYRIEYILGFVTAMTFTFGAVLPLAFSLTIGLISAVLYHLVRPVFVRFGKNLGGGNQ